MAWVLLTIGCAADPPPSSALHPLRVEHGRDPQDGAADPVLEAPRLIEQRETPGALDRAIRILEQYRERHPESTTSLVLLAEAHSRATEVLDPAKASDKAAHELHRTEGRKYAQEAVELAPDNGEAHYWLAALLLHAADAERSLSRAKQALVELDRADRLTPAVDQGGPSRLRGKVLEDLPGLFGGSTSKAIASYRRAIEIAPNCTTTHLWLAEAYADAKEHELERKELEWVISAKVRHGHEKEDGDDQTKARELLKKLEGN